jgi:hypothetical protein
MHRMPFPVSVQSDGIVTNFNSQKSATTLSLMQQNAAIVANAVYEQNQQQVNDIFLRTVARGHANFSPGQLATLESIADQCYICGGDGVFLARSMYALVEPARVYNDGVLCGGQLIKQEPMEVETGKITFKITPNPANDWILVETNASEPFEGEIQLLDITGKIMRNEAVVLGDGLQHLLDLTTLQSGYYICQIIQNGKAVATEKVVISK